MLVPSSVAYPPFRYVEVMPTPGAARSTTAPKLLNDASVSSLPYKRLTGPFPPGWPSVSTIAETVITSSNEAGTVPAASTPELPAATTYVTPAATDRHTASCKAPSLQSPLG